MDVSCCLSRSYLTRMGSEILLSSENLLYGKQLETRYKYATNVNFSRVTISQVVARIEQHVFGTLRTRHVFASLLDILARLMPLRFTLIVIMWQLDQGTGVSDSGIVPMVISKDTFDIKSNIFIDYFYRWMCETYDRAQSCYHSSLLLCLWTFRGFGRC